MSEETTVEETKEEVATETKTPKKAKPKAKPVDKGADKTSPKKPVGKKSVSKMTERAGKGKKVAKAAKPKSDKPKGSSRNVEVEVGGKKVQWNKKKAAVLLALRTLKKEATKIEIAEELEKMGMSDGNVNKFCWEMAEEKLVDMTDYEGDHNWYRSVTEKGKKVVLPKLYI